MRRHFKDHFKLQQTQETCKDNPVASTSPVSGSQDRVEDFNTASGTDGAGISNLDHILMSFFFLLLKACVHFLV